MALYRGTGGAGDSTTDATVTDVTAQAVAASSSASAAATSATQAATSATAASGSATTASGHATTALGHANDANTAKTAAQAAQTAAELAADNIDDIYLGAKSSDPTVDNDGDALTAGDLYFNTSTNTLKVYTGSAWVNAAVSASDFLSVANNLSDLNNAATARTNLGLGTVATTASTDYATAAQGAKADSALQSFTETNDLSAAVVWANVPNSNITQASVTQHQAALSITESQVSDLGTYATTALYTTTVTGSAGSSDWTGSGPYIATKTVSGLLANDTPIVDIDLSGASYSDVTDIGAEWATVYRVEASSANTLKVYATAEPAKSFSLQIKVVR